MVDTTLGKLQLGKRLVGSADTYPQSYQASAWLVLPALINSRLDKRLVASKGTYQQPFGQALGWDLCAGCG
ncbi:hypothetical protein GCM10009828_005820 [Actinoplanes couchii]|uniref:Uncharacterized protein n=1 Tax=Actinoplanes couchii TaxID=403638 RepID=A0ABQ3XK44_9ACTN|nr:hypothetical protein Aco03nite_072410 [Actinoplanes couchii]